MQKAPSDMVKVLVDKGVKMPLPQTVYIDPDVDPKMISGKDVVIYPGCRISGSTTIIMEGCVLGADGPVTLRDCQLGKGVSLASGSFEKSCFLDGAKMGPGAQVRQCCLMEEGARGAHSVAIKHTILFPFVTLGSLINFCDCLMAGGTDEKNHSEVGSSYIHFNYTPNQDKATASLIGDVPRGVMLNQAPIFLGGQGGLVGPVRIGYGVVVAAGTIVRKDLLQENMVLLGYPSVTKKIPRRLGLYSNIRRIVELNSIYIANLISLRTWYTMVRRPFFEGTKTGNAFCRAAVGVIEMATKERIRRLGEVAQRMEDSIKILSGMGRSEGALINRSREFYSRWPQVQSVFEKWLDTVYKDEHYERFEKGLEKVAGGQKTNYISTIKSLEDYMAREGTAWLEAIITRVLHEVWHVLPSFGLKEGNYGKAIWH